MERDERGGLQHCRVPSLPVEHPGSSFPPLFLFLACSGFFIVMVTEIWCRGSEMLTALSSLGGRLEDLQSPTDRLGGHVLPWQRQSVCPNGPLSSAHTLGRIPAFPPSPWELHPVLHP